MCLEKLFKIFKKKELIMNFSGKGMYIWKIRNCEGADIQAIVSKAKKANLDHVVIKIADGPYGYNYIDGVDMAKALCDALKAEGITPYGFQYIYGVDPRGEALTAVRRMRETGCLGFVINAEQEYRDLVNNEAVAGIYMSYLSFPEPKALSTYRYPEIHPTFPYEVFLSGCSVNMPQVYWMQETDTDAPIDNLDECIRQYEEFSDVPIVPTGAAFCEHGWCASVAQIKNFADHAMELELTGINYWEWSNTVDNGLWPAIKAIDWQGPEEPPPPIDCTEAIRAGQIIVLDESIAAINVIKDRINGEV